MKIALVFSITAAVNAFICPVPLCPLCPLCPVIAGAAAQGTLTAGNALLTSSIAATASVPFLLAFIDGFRTRNMSFDFPSPETVYHAGETYPLFMHTFGLASRMHLRTADLYLLNSSFDRVLKIASEREFKVLHDVERSKLGVPGKGIGHLDFTLPSSLSSGVYYIKYVSGWTIWRKEGQFQAVTDGFVIADASDAACTTVDCIQGLNQSLIRQPSSFTADDAPLELQFMFTHIPFKQVPQKFMNGVIDGVAAIPRAIVNPNLNTIKHPIEAMKNLSREWEEEEEKDPYKANGQAFGVGMAVGIPSQLLVQKLMNKKSGNAAAEPSMGCTGSNCGHDRDHAHEEAQAPPPAVCTGPNCDHNHDHARAHEEAQAPPPAVCTGPNCDHNHDHARAHEEAQAPPPPAVCTGPNCGHNHDHARAHEEVQAPPPAVCTGPNCDHNHDHARAHEEAQAPPPPAVCTGPKCGHTHDPQSAVAPHQHALESQNHVFQVEGSSANSIKTYLESHGSAVKVSEMRDGGSGFVQLTLENAKLNAAKLAEMIQKDLGFIVRLGTF